MPSSTLSPLTCEALFTRFAWGLPASLSALLVALTCLLPVDRLRQPAAVVELTSPFGTAAPVMAARRLGNGWRRAFRLALVAAGLLVSTTGLFGATLIDGTDFLTS